MKKPTCNCGIAMRRMYTRRGAQGKKHNPEGWLCTECGAVIFE